MNATETEMFEVALEDVEYLRPDGVPLIATIYRPQGEGLYPMVLHVHGGAWCRGSRQDEHTLNHALASQGITVASLDFRMPPQATYPASLCDINAALRWFKANARRWQARPQSIGVMGVSSGGHQAVLTALRARDSRYLAAPLPSDGQVDACAAFVVACWPVIDPLGRYLYAKEKRAGAQPYPQALDRVIPDHEKYWLTEQAMQDGAPAYGLETGEPMDLPPMLCVQGEDDVVHPRAHLERFIAAYRAAGGDVQLGLYPGQVEGFITKKPEIAATAAAINDIVEFIKRCDAAA
jgi:acetyl esterase